MKIHVIYVPFAYIASALGKTFPFAQKHQGRDLNLTIRELPAIQSSVFGCSLKLAAVRVATTKKINMAPEKWWLEDEFPLGIANF